MRVMLRNCILPGLLAVLLCAAGVVRLQAQGTGTTEEQKQEKAAPEGQMGWKLANTAIFAVLLGWGIAKAAPGFFNARSADIQKAIKEATGLKIEADFRYSAIDRKMATLGEQVKRMQAEWEAAMEYERQHIQAETQAERERIQHHLEAEIDGFRAESEYHLRQHAAKAAFALAEQRLRDLGPSQEDALLGDFVNLVERTPA